MVVLVAISDEFIPSSHILRLGILRRTAICTSIHSVAVLRRTAIAIPAARLWMNILLNAHPLSVDSTHEHAPLGREHMERGRTPGSNRHRSPVALDDSGVDLGHTT